MHFSSVDKASTYSSLLTRTTLRTYKVNRYQWCKGSGNLYSRCNWGQRSRGSINKPPYFLLWSKAASIELRKIFSSFGLQWQLFSRFTRSYNFEDNIHILHPQKCDEKPIKILQNRRTVIYNLNINCCLFFYANEKIKTIGSWNFHEIRKLWIFFSHE